MTLDVYYPADIQRILQALASAGAVNGPSYLKALADVALAFGVQSPLGWLNLSWSVTPGQSPPQLVESAPKTTP